MYILAIETTGPLGSAAVIDEKGSVSLAVSAEEMNHLKDLMPMSRRLLQQLQIEPQDLTAVAASIGPGSFTGIRIGVASARAVAQALSIPALAVPSLDSFKLMCGSGSLTVPVFNARRGQVYGGIYGENGEDILQSGPYMLTDVLSSVSGYLSGNPGIKVTFYGDGVDAYEEQLAAFCRQNGDLAEIRMAEKKQRYQNAAMTARVALDKYRAGERLSPEELQPDYMRTTEAEQKLKDGRLAAERAAKLARFRSR